MGTISVDNAELTLKYGALGVRFNTLRALYKCVRKAINTEEDPEGCLTE